jgi:hypothetical protein
MPARNIASLNKFRQVSVGMVVGPRPPRNQPSYGFAIAGRSERLNPTPFFGCRFKKTARLKLMNCIAI